DREYDARLQGGPIRCKQPIKSASEPVVTDLARRNQSCIVKCRPFPDGIERVALDQDVLDQRQQHFGVARTVQRHGQLCGQPHAADYAIKNRYCANTPCVEAQIFRLHGSRLESYAAKMSSGKITVTSPGPILSGTVSTVHAKCGKPTCRCYHDRKY